MELLEDLIDTNFLSQFETGCPLETKGAYPCTSVSALATGSPQRFQELYDGVLVGAFQFFKLLNDVFGLAAVPGDGFQKC